MSPTVADSFKLNNWLRITFEMQDLYMSLNKRESTGKKYIYMAKNTWKKPSKIVQDALGNEPDHILSHVKGYTSLKRKIEQGRSTKAQNRNPTAVEHLQWFDPS